MTDITKLVLEIVIGVLALVAGLLIGYLIRRNITEKKIGRSEVLAEQILADARSQGEALKKEKLIEAKEEIHTQLDDLEKEIRDRRAEVSRSERRVQQKEDALDKRSQALEVREEKNNQAREEISRAKEKAEELLTARFAELERVAGLSAEEARQQVMIEAENSARHDAALMIRDVERDAKADADKIARKIITQAIQRCAADQASEATVSVVTLPNEEMKGRIIGREGRNIRALETVTGVDFIIDDTPEAVILSGFDPVRREIARITLERLVADGRIHPARIEELTGKVRKEIEQQIREEGEAAVFDVGITGVHPELVKVLGRLKYRTSYGQNVLKHSIEVAHLAGMMAAEVGANVRVAKRAGLLHDIGKAVDREVEGSHAKIGTDLARRYREHNDIIHCIQAHHNDVEPNTAEAVLVQAADAISGARPGARREMLESYIKRLEKLEEIANSFEGVDKSFAIQAGREVRIAVLPDKVDDAEAVLMARDIAHRIEKEMEYPGQIKVNVIRETRATEFAK
ncbi:MAG: ribonuclease Y [Christensenellales bacterium]